MATISKYGNEYRFSADDGTTYYIRPTNDGYGDWYVIEYPPFGAGAPRQTKYSTLNVALTNVVLWGVKDFPDLTE